MCLDVSADVLACMYDQVSEYLGMECAGSGGRYLGSGVWVNFGVMYLDIGICVEL